MFNYLYKYTYNYMIIHIWISFVTHTIILGYTYNYMSSCTYILSFVLHTIILEYTYIYMSRYFNYTIIINICKYLIQLYLYLYQRYTYKYMSTYKYFSICIWNQKKWIVYIITMSLNINTIMKKWRWHIVIQIHLDKYKLSIASLK